MKLVRKLWQTTVMRYLFVGGTSYVFELSSLLLLMYAAGFSAQAATASAYWLGLVIAFVLQKVVAFQDYRRELKILTKQGLLFAALTIWNWVFTTAFVGLFPADDVIWTRTLALVIMSVWNFVIYKKYIFRDGESTKQATKASGAWWQRLLRDPLLLYSIGFVAVWRAALEVLSQIVGKPTYSEEGFANHLAPWANWDGGWYQSIIDSGYMPASDPDHAANVAFFPGFPWFVDGLSQILHVDRLYVGLVLNILFTILAVYLVMKLAQLFVQRYGSDKSKKYARSVIFLSAALLLLHPASFFLVAFYTEALLVTGFLGAVYCALTGRLWAAVPFMILASASKVTGMLAVGTVGLIVLEGWWSGRSLKTVPKLLGRWAITTLGASGLIGYMIYLWQWHGDPLLFYKVEELWGRTHEGFFLPNVIHDYYSYMFEPAHYNATFDYAMALTYMITPLLLIGAGLWVAVRYRMIWPFALGLLAMLIPVSTSLMEGLNRYSLVAAPFFPLIILWLRSKARPVFISALLLISGVAMLCTAYGFLIGTYFAG